MEFTRSTLLPLASSAAKLGFDAGRWGTKLGFSISRSITSSAVQLGSAAVDYGLGWNNPEDGLFEGPTSRLASGAVQLGFGSVEWIVGRGIDLGETLTQSSINAAAYAVESISDLYGDTQEASFSLGAFVQLVRRELNDPEHAADVPGRAGAEPVSTASRSVVQVAQSLAAWAAIQTMTAEYQEKQLLAGMREIDVDEWKRASRSPKRPGRDLADAPADLDEVEDVITDLSVTSGEDETSGGAHITTADIGKPGDALDTERFSDSDSDEPASPLKPVAPQRSRARDRAYIRRMSKITLGSYGGAGLIFFGAPLPETAGSANAVKSSKPPSPADQDLAEGAAINAEMHAAEPGPSQPKGKGKAKQLWETVTGAHDEAIFKHYAGLHVEDLQDALEANDAGIVAERGTDTKKPRFWVLTDHRRKEIVLALRGTMSLNELAIDLTCDPVPFSPASTADQSKGEETTESKPNAAAHQVHEGFLKIAQQMGGQGGPVLRSVQQAMEKNPGYSLVLTGHSLGAGVAALLALMWADPSTSLTTGASGLPPNVPLHAYCFAIPCVTSAPLSELARPMITSIVLSYDFVSRLSLGSIRDLKKVSEWLMYAVDEPDQKCNNIVRKALRIRAGGVGMSQRQKEMEADWFLSLRKTLEANMDCAHLFPVGTVYHAFLPQDLTPPPDVVLSPESTAPVRLFEVTDVAKAYKQIVFASNMLSCHLPHQYDNVVSNHL